MDDNEYELDYEQEDDVKGGYLTVDVTAEDIAEGRPFDCSSCPVARATERALGTAVLVLGSQIVWFVNRTEERRISLPASIVRWINRFDTQGPAHVSAVQFELRVPA